jgi:hypothetical protein
MLSETTRREIRRTLIRLAEKQQRPGSGSNAEFLRRRTAMAVWPDLTPVLGDIRWAAIGAVATRHYMPERATQDLDVAIAVAYAREARRRLRDSGFRHSAELSVQGASWVSPDGPGIDVLELEDPWSSEALHQAQANRDLQGLPVLPLPYLVLLKYQAGRLQDTADIGRMLGQSSEVDLAAVRTLFAREAPEDLEDIEILSRLGKLEMEGP